MAWHYQDPHTKDSVYYIYSSSWDQSFGQSDGCTGTYTIIYKYIYNVFVTKHEVGSSRQTSSLATKECRPHFQVLATHSPLPPLGSKSRFGLPCSSCAAATCRRRAARRCCVLAGWGFSLRVPASLAAPENATRKGCKTRLDRWKGLGGGAGSRIGLATSLCFVPAAAFNVDVVVIVPPGNEVNKNNYTEVVVVVVVVVIVVVVLVLVVVVV